MSDIRSNERITFFLYLSRPGNVRSSASRSDVNNDDPLSTSK